MGSSSQSVDTRFGRRLGAGAWLFGYLATYALAWADIQHTDTVRLFDVVSGNEGAWRIAGWIFYNTHFVETSVDPSLFGTGAINFIVQSDDLTWVLYLLPPAVLLATGAIAAHLAGRKSATAGAKAGTALVPGYFALAAVGALAFGISSGGSSAGPEVLTAVFMAGLFYPAVFGALGGAVGAELSREVTAGESAPTG